MNKKAPQPKKVFTREDFVQWGKSGGIKAQEKMGKEAVVSNLEKARSALMKKRLTKTTLPPIVSTSNTNNP